MSDYLIQIPPDKVEVVRRWFTGRGGVMLWRDQEVTSSPKPDTITPANDILGNPTWAPHWAFRPVSLITPAQIGVREETTVERAGDPIKVAVRKLYWGYDISDTGKMKARSEAKKLGLDVLWTWEHCGFGLANLVFYREKVTPFTL